MNSAQFPVIKMEDPYCDVEVERNEGEQGSSSSGGTLPYMSTFSGKHGGPASVTMFYPQLSGYDIHPLLINQRRRSAQNDKLIEPQDPLEDSPPLNPGLSNHQLKDVRFKQKLKAPKRRPNEIQDESFPVLPENPAGLDNEASDYSAKNRKSFYCRACGKAFKFQTSLLRHNNKVHISKYQCPTCSRVFSRQAYLDVHTSKQGSSCYLGMADYFEEMGWRPLENGETPNHFLHFARLLRDFGMFEELGDDKKLPPPTSKEFVDNLERQTVKGREHKCPVCLRVSNEGEVIVILPCKHGFHSDCILPWLARTSTCPLCRHEMVTDDEDYEKYKKEKLRAKERENDLKTLHNSMFS